MSHIVLVELNLFSTPKSFTVKRYPLSSPDDENPCQLLTGRLQSRYHSHKLSPF